MPAYAAFLASCCHSDVEANGSMIWVSSADRTTENHGVDSSILSLATSFFLHMAVVWHAHDLHWRARSTIFHRRRLEGPVLDQRCHRFDGVDNGPV